MIKKYSNLFDCSTDVSIQLHTRHNVYKRKNDILVHLRMQLKMIDNYRQEIERKINRIRSAHLQKRPGQFDPLPASKAHLEDKRQELFQFLMMNNEQIRNYHSDYKQEQDRKVQKIMQEYAGLIKIDHS